MTRPNVYGTRAVIAGDNDPLYKCMADEQLAQLRTKLSAAEYQAWQRENFEQFGGTIADYTHRDVFVTALLENMRIPECSHCNDAACTCQPHDENIPY